MKRRDLRFMLPHDKARWLDGRASLESEHPTIRAFASRVTEARREDGPSAIANSLQVFVRDSIRYVKDSPNGEEELLDDAPTVLERGYDDCDGKSRLFVALVRAADRALRSKRGPFERGGPYLEARIRPVFTRAEDFVHVQAEVRWPGSKTWPNADREGWVLAEVIVLGCGLGQDPLSIKRGPDGKLPIA